jgi:hypothetical protein
VIGAYPHQRTEARTAQRNGHRPRTISTTAGDLDLRIPRLWVRSFFPSLLEGGGGWTTRCSRSAVASFRDKGDNRRASE